MAQQRVEPYSGSRIFWDISSERTIFAPGNYARMIQLQDGRLMAVAQSSGAIRVSISNDLGDTWSPRVVVAQSPTGIANAVPDICQLKDGIILVGYNPRPNQPYSEERKFGIRARRSTDNGQTWSHEIFIFDATHTNADGCWEPVFLELPSGEIHCYFANENDYRQSNEQNISVCRSFDKGLTWSAPEIVSFRTNHRDGMPAPVLLAGSNEIVVIIEDNGYPGGYSPRFQPVTVRTSLEDNWKGGFVNAASPAREYALEMPLAPSINAAAPYLRQLSSGETILSYHGSENRPAGDNFQEMFVLVGNPEARKFKAKSNPFALPEANRGMWNSVSVIENDVVVAITSTNLYNTSGGNDIVMLKGYPLNKIIIKKGSVEVDGVRGEKEIWSTDKAEQLILGTKAKARCGIDFLYDDKNLYLTAKISDKLIMSESSVKDAIRVMLDVDDVSSTSPYPGTFNIQFDAGGSIQMQRGVNGSWVAMSPEGIEYAVEIVENRYYQIEAAIPWSLLEIQTPPLDRRMAIGVELLNVHASGYVLETIPDMQRNVPASWIETRLSAESVSSVGSIHRNDAGIVLTRKGNNVDVFSDELIRKYKLYSIDGRLIGSKEIHGKSFSFQPSNDISILVIYHSGNRVYSKVIVKPV
jgi:hypothetical protein